VATGPFRNNVLVTPTDPLPCARGSYCPPPARVVLLGASNLTRGIGTAVPAVRRGVGLPPSGPLEILLAYGHGRSYGMDSTVLARTLPGIIHCGLWDDLASRPPAPTFALLTDIGNDIMYGAEPATILGWVDQCVDRLAGVDATVVMTTLPMASVRRLRPAVFRFFKAMFFPGRPITLAQAVERAEAVEAGLRELALRRPVRTVEPRLEWYGPDPVHVRLSAWSRAWPAILSAWRDGRASSAPPVRGSLRAAFAIRTTMPARHALLGRWRVNPNPVRRLGDGTTAAMY